MFMIVSGNARFVHGGPLDPAGEPGRGRPWAAGGIWHGRPANEKEKGARRSAALVGTRLAARPVVNRLPEPRPSRDELAPLDPARHALEARIELAKERLFADLDEAQKQLRRVASNTARSVARVVLLGGVVVLGIVTALVLRSRRRRLRIMWK
jgi:hypothetical protein